MKLTPLFCLLLLGSIFTISFASPAQSLPDPVEPHLVKDINTCTESSTPGVLAKTDREIFFIAHQANIGTSLWRSDGTESGTVRFKTFEAEPYLRFYGSSIWLDGSFFFLTSPDSKVYSLWVSDGTEAGTQWIYRPDTGAPICFCLRPGPDERGDVLCLLVVLQQ